MSRARDAADADTDTVYACTCGATTPSMDAFVDHVSDAHDALDVAVNSLLDAEVTVRGDD